MSAPGPRHEIEEREGADPHQGDLLELLRATEADQEEYRHARQS